jgi:uncharacterized membrane protein YidH (DUF202 family)
MITGSPGSGQQPSEHALFDLNAAAERTSLAWQRSGLGMIGVGALFIRGHALLSVLVGCVLVGTGILVTTLLGPWRYQAILARVRAKRSPSSRWVILLAAVVLCASAGAGFGVIGLR